MGHKRRKRQNSAKPLNHSAKLWPEAVTDELLSCLDSKIAVRSPATNVWKNGDLEQVNQELAAHLNNCDDVKKFFPQQRPSYSAQQVRDKLRHLTAKCKDLSEWTVVYTRGSACLDWSDDDHRQERILRRAKAIQHKWVTEFLRSPRKLRASSKGDAKPATVQHEKSARKRSYVPSSPEEGPRPKLARTVLARSARGISEAQHVSDTDVPATEDTEETNSRDDSYTPGPSTPRTAKRGQTRRLPPEAPQMQFRVKQETRTTPTVDSSPAVLGQTISSDSSEPVTDISKLRNDFIRLQNELKVAKRNAELDVDFWKMLYRSADRERARLRQSASALAATRNLQAGKGREYSDEEELLKRQAVIDDLRSQLTSRQLVQDLTPEMDAKVDQKGRDRLLKLMDAINGLLKEALRDVVFTNTPHLESISEDSILGSLLMQAFGSRKHWAVVKESLSRCHKKPWEDQQALLVSLCGAALARWIFQETHIDILFDGYSHGETRSSTNRYREAIQLVRQNDPALACAVDLLVHKKVAKELEQDDFKDFQRHKAEDLANRLWLALAPLYNLESHTDEHSDRASLLHARAVSSLVDVFVGAFDMVRRLMLGGGRYECAWYEPGTTFDPATMKLHRRDAGEGYILPSGATVSLTLLPGINQIAGCMTGVDCGGFSQQCQRGRDRPGSVCILEATVLCGNADLLH